MVTTSPILQGETLSSSATFTHWWLNRDSNPVSDTCRTSSLEHFWPLLCSQNRPTEAHSALVSTRGPGSRFCTHRVPSTCSALPLNEALPYLCVWVEVECWDWNEIESICRYPPQRKYLHPGWLVGFQSVTLKFVRLYCLKIIGFLNFTDSSSHPKRECVRSFSLPRTKKD